MGKGYTSQIFSSALYLSRFYIRLETCNYRVSKLNLTIVESI